MVASVALTAEHPGVSVIDRIPWRPASALHLPPRYNGAYCTGDSTFGLVGNHQYDECWRFCLIRCSPRSEYGMGMEGAEQPRDNAIALRVSRSACGLLPQDAYRISLLW
jgi:hypothetical protein